MSSDIHLEIAINAPPKRIYDTLLDAKQFSAFTGGAPAVIEPTEGGAFSCFGGHIEGRNVELKPGKRIVQAWRAKTWSEGLYSIVRFELSKSASGTTLVMDHSGVPEAALEHMTAGWTKMYWDPLKKHLA